MVSKLKVGHKRINMVVDLTDKSVTELLFKEYSKQDAIQEAVNQYNINRVPNEQISARELTGVTYQVTGQYRNYYGYVYENGQHTLRLQVDAQKKMTPKEIEDERRLKATKARAAEKRKETMARRKEARAKADQIRIQKQVLKEIKKNPELKAELWQILRQEA